MPSPKHQVTSTEFPTLLDYLNWLRRHKLFIAVGTFTGIGVGLVISSMTIQTFRSEIIFQAANTTEGAMEDPESIDHSVVQMLTDPVFSHSFTQKFFSSLDARPPSDGQSSKEISQILTDDLRREMLPTDRSPAERLTNLLRVGGFGGQGDGDVKNRFQFFFRRHDRTRYILALRGSLRSGLQIVADSAISALNGVILEFNARTKSVRVEYKQLLLANANERFAAAQQEILTIEPEFRRNFVQLTSDFLDMQEEVTSIEVQLKVKPPDVRNADPFQLVVSQSPQGPLGISPFPIMQKRIEDLEIEYLGKRIANIQRQAAAPRDRVKGIMDRFSTAIGQRVRLEATLAPVAERFSASGATVSQLIYDASMPVDPRTYAIPMFVREEAYMVLGAAYAQQQSKTATVLVSLTISLAIALGAAWLSEQKSVKP